MKRQQQRVHKDLQGLYQEAPIGLCSLDTNLRYLQINDWLAALNGLPVEAHLGRTIREVLPDVAAGVEQQLRKVIETGEPIIDGRVDAETPAHPGVVRAFQHHYYPNRSEDGRIVGVSCVVAEITERKRAEEALKDKTDQLEAITASMTAYLETGNWREASARILRSALQITESQYGFVGVVVEGPVLRILAHEGIVWDTTVNRALYEQALRTYQEVGYLEFPNFDNLFGRVITSGQVVLANDPATHPHSGGVPPGHPPLRHFLGVPIRRGTEVVGMIAVANRPAGYTGIEEEKIRTLTQAAGVLYENYRQREHEAALEAEQKRADEAFERLSRQNELILNSAGEGIYGLDLEGRTTFINPAAAQMIGWEVEELLGKPQHAILHHSKPDGSPYPREECPISAPFKDGAVHHVDTEVFWRKDGTSFPVDYTSTPIRDEQGQLAGAVVTFRDTTERKRAEEALRRAHDELEARVTERTARLAAANAQLEAEITERKKAEDTLRETNERLRLLLETTSAVPWEADARTWRFTYVGPQAVKLLNYPVQQWYEKDFWATHLHPEDRQRAIDFCESSSRKLADYEFEYRMVSADGRVVWFHDLVSVVSANGVPTLLRGVMIDMTERKRAEEALRELTGRLITAQEQERARIARELHDDVNQKLALLAVDLELLGQTPPHSPAETTQQARNLSAQVKAISSDVHRLSHRLHPSKIEQLGLVAAMKSLCRELSLKHDVRVQFSDRDVQGPIPEDIALCLYRIAQEALANVVKHSGARDAWVELVGSPTAIHLRISDPGRGFNPNSVKGSEGLGLVSMQERVHLVRGEIAIDSQPARGTRINVRVLLPSAPS